MACVSLEAGDADRSKRFKHSAQATPPGAPAFFPEGSSSLQFGHQSLFQGPVTTAYATAADTRPGAAEAQPALAPPASTVVPSPLALPAASQQYPVLPQAAASAAAATATAAVLQAQEAALRQHWNQADDTFAAAGKKHTYMLDAQQQLQQQQRRRAGPANQWRPGMPLAQQPTQAYAGPQQTAHVPSSTQQLQWPPGSLAQQILQGGALGAALQKLLPLPGQLMATQQQHQSAAGPSQLPSVFPVQQQALQQLHLRPQLLPQHTQQSASTATQQRPLHILQGIPAALPVLVPSAPQGPQNKALADSAGPDAAAGGGAGAAGAGDIPGADAGAATPSISATAGQISQPIQAHGAAANPGVSANQEVSCSPQDLTTSLSGGAEGPDDQGAGWLKLLSCVVDPQGDSLALELLLAGQIYKGHLTRVSPADPAAPAAAPTPAEVHMLSAATAAAAAAGAAAGMNAGQAGSMVGSADEAAAVLDLAQEREGMCFLCALPFAKQAEGTTPRQTLAQAAAVQTALANNEVGTAAVAMAGNADGTAAAGGHQQGSLSAPATAEQLQGNQLPPQPLQQQQQQQAGEECMGPPQQEQQHKESSMLEALGPAVQCDLGLGCCIMLHQACAEASTKAAARGHHHKEQQQQQHEASCMQQLLACLSNHCCGCGQRAASLRCAAPGCSRMFHVPCVQGMGASVSQDGSCWCSEHQHVKMQKPTAGPFADHATASETATDAAMAHDVLSSPEPMQTLGINPSPSFAAALVLQQMRCSKGFDVLLLGTDAQLGTDPTPDSSSGAGSSIHAAAAAAGGVSAGRGAGGAAGRTRTSAHRRLLEAMPPSNGTSSTGPWGHYNGSNGTTARRDGSQAAGLYNSTAEASRQYHLEQQQQAAYGGVQNPASTAQRPAASMLLQRLQQQSGQPAWQRQQQQQQQQQHVGVGPTRRSPQSNKGRPPLPKAYDMPPGKAKGSWNTLGLVSAFALAQQQEEEARQQQEQQQRQQQQQQQRQQLAASHAAAAAVVVSGPTVVVPRVRAKKGAAGR